MVDVIAIVIGLSIALAFVGVERGWLCMVIERLRIKRPSA